MSTAEARAARAARDKPRTGTKGPRCAQDFADCVNRCLDSAVEHIILAGDMLIRGKEALDHGEWLRMFNDHDNPVDRPIPFGARKGQMLMRIAEHPTLSDANHGSQLPHSWRTLYELTKVPEETLVKALGTGAIHPGMERRDVRALQEKPELNAPKPKPRPNAAPKKGAPYEQALEELHAWTVRWSHLGNALAPAFDAILTLLEAQHPSFRWPLPMAEEVDTTAAEALENGAVEAVR